MAVAITLKRFSRALVSFQDADVKVTAFPTKHLEVH